LLSALFITLSGAAETIFADLAPPAVKLGAGVVRNDYPRRIVVLALVGLQGAYKSFLFDLLPSSFSNVPESYIASPLFLFLLDLYFNVPILLS